MKSALLKDTLREVKKSLGRFLSILAIVAIGVAFFAGVKAAVPDMKHTADQYFDDYKLEDMQLISTIGFTRDDVDAIKAVDGVEGVMAVHNMNALTVVDKRQLVLAVHGLPANLNADNPDYLNQANLVEGRLPKSSGECLIEQGKIGSEISVKIGDTIQLTSGTDTNISETLKTDTYKVVGITLSPYYLSYQKGTTNIGSGTINNFMMIPDSDFKSEYFTEMNISVKGARALNSYDDAYFDIVKPIKKKIKALSKDRIDVRKEEIRSKAEAEINKQEQLYTTNKNTFDTQIQDAETKLEATRIKLKASKEEIVRQRSTLETTYQQNLEKITSGETQLKAGIEQYNVSKQALDDRFQNEIQPALIQLQEKLGQNQEGYKQLNDILGNTLIQLENEKNKIPQDQAKIEELENDISVYEGNLKGMQAVIESLQQQIADLGNTYNDALAKLDAVKAQLDATSSALSNSRTQLDQGKAEAAAKLNAAAAQVKNGWKQYKSAKGKLSNEKTFGQQELNNAWDKLNNAKQSIDELSTPKWYVLDRHSQYSYMDYGSAADRMDAIAKVFPVFFFVVAALVCLTTMTRMVDEQRETIGTLKALGYTRSAIASKYVAYAAAASIAGSIVGCVIGMIVFPTVIFNAWGLMYSLPPVKLTLQLPLALLTTAIAVVVTTAAAFMAVYRELVETPSLLMRPKAPKNGKKILLERVTFLWKHFSFTEKVTARNIFRYKKRFLMTVIGISGCTALLLAGFGIRDSISQVVSKQYGNIFKYDVSITLDSGLSLYQKHETLIELQKDKRIQGIMPIAQYNGNIQDGDQDSAITIVVPSDVKQYQTFTSLHERTSQKELTLSDHGAIITEKIASELHVGAGDTIQVDNGSGSKRKVKITGVVENYINHYLYMSPEYYREIFKERATENVLIADLKDDRKSVENAIGQDLVKRDEINSVVFFTGMAESFNDTISSLNIVTVVLVISAGLLAFVVLYNLTNVNVSERLREIATIKVLGFYDKEVSAYVYRENILLTFIGAGTGLLLGILLHRIIMSVAEMDTVMFGRNIEPLSFLYAVLITIGFALIVNLAMYPKLKKIPMVESLKSVE